MHTRVFFSVVGAAISAVVLVSASGSAAARMPQRVGADVSTRAAIVHYLRSIHVGTKGLVIQRGASNYAGSHCPGKHWACAKTTHTVVQVARPGGKNTFSCAGRSCRVLQVAESPSVATNTARCVRTRGLLQVCVIVQWSATANNVAAVYEHANSSSGLVRSALSAALIIQRATGASNSNTACVYQAIGLDASRNAGFGHVNAWLGAHQYVSIYQDSAHGGNSAGSSATAAGACDTANPLTQTQTLTSTVSGPRSVRQNENSANLGANVTLDIEQNQSPGFLGSAEGTNAVDFEQDNVLTAIANTPAGPIDQTQSSVNGGVLGTVNQDSRDPSTIVATQHETQCEDGAQSGLTSCDTNDPDAPEAPASLTQIQYGPVRKGVGTATQTGNSGDTFTLNQTSQQDTDQGSGSSQSNVVQGDCSTAGTCSLSQGTSVNGNQTTNTQSGQNLSSGINCTGSSCQATVPPAPSIDTHPPNPSNSSDAAFTFSDSQQGVSFLCQLDESGYAPCTSPQEYGELSEGTHTFSVEAKDGNGNVGPATSYGWTIALPRIVFDGSPGTGAPPSTLGPYTMTAFGSDPQPTCSTSDDTVTTALTSSVSDPVGTIAFDKLLNHDRIGDAPNCWATWSNGYTGDVYDTLYSTDPTSVTITLPSGTQAFYLYAEPNAFEDFTITAMAQDGATSGPITVNGEGGAKYYGFYGINGATIASITVTDSDQQPFAVGEFGISPAAFAIP